MPAARIDGTEIAYEIVGNRGPPWVITPGGRFGLDTPGIRELAEELARHGQRVVIWDRPNCGGSDVCFEGASESVMQADKLAGLLRALDMVANSPELRETLFAHARKFRAGMTAAGFKLLPGEHPIIPVMIGDAALAARFAESLLAEGVYVIGFSLPLVPKGEARIRTQMSAGLNEAQIDRALAAFVKVGRALELVK